MNAEELKAQRRAETVRRKTLAQKCPTCGAAPKKDCTIVLTRRASIPLSRPHRARVFAAIEAQRVKTPA